MMILLKMVLLGILAYICHAPTMACSLCYEELHFTSTCRVGCKRGFRIHIYTDQKQCMVTFMKTLKQDARDSLLGEVVVIC